MAEVWARQIDFASETRQERLQYLRGKPVPLVRGASGELWMVDRHHRLRALLEIDPHATTPGYLIADQAGNGLDAVLAFLQLQGWLSSTTVADAVHGKQGISLAPCLISRTTLTEVWFGS